MSRLSLMSAGLVLALAWAASAQSSQITVDHAWSRATPPRGTTGVLYLTLTSPTGDKLLGVSTPAAASAELHRSQTTGTVMQMRPVEGGLDLPPGKPVTLGPGGYHVMLMGLKMPLKAGSDVPVHLTFQTAPPLDVVARVQGLGGGMADMPGMHAH
ncbi:copper chaperone PCu(A)C [Acidisphaera sp. L21]|jgi:copper(I)-binding protein|uniref:copper chaperone PCu(A)C n=1 Tax=Acidisphaera sp. L21 TaxID=1641851 RepID=UPI00131C86BA|nr:copper chaperone PCu(A)C [Acidisphaera sp. L21]